ncbi:MAG TPA: zf-HC2 domain-containing protein [Ktedonobacteraceae bacterium]
MLADSYELSCKEVVKRLTDYLEHTLLSEMQEYVETHLANCPGCRIYLEQILQTMRLVRGLSEQQLPAALKHARLQAFRSWQHAEGLGTLSLQQETET